VLLLTSCQDKGRPDLQGKPPALPGEVSLSAAAIASAGIQTEPARQERLERVLTLTGTLAAAPWTPEEQTAISEGLEADSNLRLAESTFARASELSAQGITSKQDLNLARAELERARAVAAQAAAKRANLGLSPNVKSFAGEAKLWGLANMPEGDFPSVAAGQRVVIQTASVPDRTFSGRVVALSGSSDAQTRNFTVRIAVDEPTDRLRPQTLATFALSLPAFSGLTIPSSAVLVEGDGSYVYVAQGTTFSKQPIRKGPSSSGRVAVLEGLSDAQLVVTHGAQILESERLKSTSVRQTD
jgi:multidrug efflux pump subunit AcrA (membrane-fusion protein)